jgi:uncharacterized phiE125 gp8 family phage protein
MSGSLHLITPPTDEVVTAAEAQAQVPLLAAASDQLLEALIAAAVSQIDPAGGGWLGRALRPQTWELRLSGFPSGYYCGSGYTRDFKKYNAIELPYPPQLLVDSVKYDDGDGVERTLAVDTDYRVLGGGTGKSYIAPVYNGSWPSSVRCDAEAVRVRFTSGYENETAGDELPASIKQAVLLMVKHLYGLGERNLFVSAETVDGVGSRNFVVSENAALVMKTASEGLLAPYRVWE